MGTDPKLPLDGWLAVHPDRTICLDWSFAGAAGVGMTPLLRFREVEPTIQAECNEGDELLEWTRVTLMPQNAAARGTGYGAVRMIDEDDDA